MNTLFDDSDLLTVIPELPLDPNISDTVALDHPYAAAGLVTLADLTLTANETIWTANAQPQGISSESTFAPPLDPSQVDVPIPSSVISNGSGAVSSVNISINRTVIQLLDSTTLRLICPLCPSVHPDLDIMLEHVNVKHKIQVKELNFKCPVCNSQSQSTELALSCIRNHYLSNQYCRIYSADSEDDDAAHAKPAGEESPESTSARPTLSRKPAAGNLSTTYIAIDGSSSGSMCCPVCDRKYLKIGFLTAHVRDRHDLGIDIVKYKCQACGKLSDDPHTIRRCQLRHLISSQPVTSQADSSTLNQQISQTHIPISPNQAIDNTHVTASAISVSTGYLLQNIPPLEFDNLSVVLSSTSTSHVTNRSEPVSLQQTNKCASNTVVPTAPVSNLMPTVDYDSIMEVPMDMVPLNDAPNINEVCDPEYDNGIDEMDLNPNFIELETEEADAESVSHNSDPTFLYESLEAIEEAVELLYSKLKPPSADVSDTQPQKTTRSTPYTNSFGSVIAGPQTLPDPKKLQSIYKKSRKKAVRIICENSTYIKCELPREDIIDHFQHPIDTEPEVALNSLATACIKTRKDAEHITSTISPEEVWLRLARIDRNTAPGPSGIGFADFMSKSSCRSLSKIFNSVLSTGNIPRQWRKSFLVLIPKNGDPALASSWRPIALQDTGYKLLAGILAERLTKWARESSTVSAFQRGFMGGDGCGDCITCLDLLRDNAKSRGAIICIAWLDFQNAFGSVSHQALIKILHKVGLPNKFVRFVEAVYEGAEWVIKNRRSEAPIPEVVGLKQGCSLSPILFNLYITAVLEAVNATAMGFPLTAAVIIACLAFADDLCLISDFPSKLQLLIDTTARISRALGIILNPKKCKTLTIDFRNRKSGVVINYSYFIDGVPIKSLSSEESFEYLGRAFGCDEKKTSREILSETQAMINRLSSSGLSGPQIYDSILTFALPKLSYIFRVGNVLDSALDKFDVELHKNIRVAFELPQNSSLAFFQAPRKRGGLGLISSADMRACALVAQTCRSLNSDTSPFSDMFRGELCLQTGCDLFELALERLQCENFTVTRHQHRFLSACKWSEVVAAIKHLRRTISLFLKLENDAVVVLTGRAGGVAAQTNVSQFYRCLRLAIGNAHFEGLLALPQQGHAFSLISRSPISSHFYRSGIGLRFSDWSFIFSARLDLLPTGAYRSRFLYNVRCRRCTREDEDLAHIMSSCMSSSILRTRRHNFIAYRIIRVFGFAVRATLKTIEIVEDKFWNRGEHMTLLAPNKEIYWNCAIPESGMSEIHPDVSFLDRINGRAFLVDVRVTYERAGDAFEVSVREKTEHYQKLIWALRKKGFQVFFYPFVVGAMGAWFDANNRLFSDLRLSNRCKKFFAKLCVRDAIGGSADIWNFHRSGEEPLSLYQPLYNGGSGYDLCIDLNDPKNNCNSEWQHIPEQFISTQAGRKRAWPFRFPLKKSVGRSLQFNGDKSKRLPASVFLDQSSPGQLEESINIQKQLLEATKLLLETVKAVHSTAVCGRDRDSAGATTAQFDAPTSGAVQAPASAKTASSAQVGQELGNMESDQNGTPRNRECSRSSAVAQRLVVCTTGQSPRDESFDRNESLVAQSSVTARAETALQPVCARATVFGANQSVSSRVLAAPGPSTPSLLGLNLSPGVRRVDSLVQYSNIPSLLAIQTRPTNSIANIFSLFYR